MLKNVDNMQMEGVRRLVVTRKSKSGLVEIVRDEVLHNYVLLTGRTAMRNLMAGFEVASNFCTKLAFGSNGAPDSILSDPYPADETQSAAMVDVVESATSYTFTDETEAPSDYCVTFLGMVDYNTIGGVYVNEAQLRNNNNNGISYTTFRSQPIELDMAIRLYWTLKYYIA